MADFNDMSDTSTASGISEDIFTGKFSTAAGLDRIRRRLLDLTRSNPLLNYRFPKSKSLRIIDTPPDDLFNRLFDGKQSPIIPVPDPPSDEYEDNDEDKPSKPEIKACARHEFMIPKSERIG